MAALRRLWHFGFMWMSLHEQMNILSGLKSTAVLHLVLTEPARRAMAKWREMR